MRDATPRSNDQDFLDALLDDAMRRLEDGQAILIDEIAAGRPHLRERIDEVLRLARDVMFGSAPSAPDLPGYSRLTELGRGGMGTVYLARQDRLAGRLVALKVLPHTAALTRHSQERFIREAEAIGRLNHPNVITIFDVIQSDGVLAYAMEWIDGGTLAKLIAEWIEQSRIEQSRAVFSPVSSNRAFPGPDSRRERKRSSIPTEPGRGRPGSDVAFICRLGVSIARALAAVHRAGLLHRDVKPSNILIRRDGTPVLSDFGVVRIADTTLTEPGGFAGTAAYSPPEQLHGETDRIDARSDVYALGVTLYHALALRPPFRADRLPDLLSAAEAGRYTSLRRIDPRIPANLETIVAKAMDAEPARRYQTADELADDLERLLNLQPIKARPAGLVTRTTKLLRRNRRSLVLAVLASTLTLAIAVTAAIYVFIVPGWVQSHVREARLALLDPASANAVFSAEFWGSVTDAGRRAARIAPDALEDALDHYDAALRLAPFDAAIHTERNVVIEAQVQNPKSQIQNSRDLRSAGLQAYLSGNVEGAMRAWSEYENIRSLSTEPDPFIEAALGILYLVREQPARAYPRLRQACQAFPDIGFMTTYLADAALQCGDVDYADRLLKEAADMPRLDPAGALQRVRADLLAAQGRDAEAQAAYRSAPQSPPLLLAFGVFLESRGRLDEAIDRYQAAALSTHGKRPLRMFAAAMDRWWAAKTPSARLRLIRGTLEDNPHTPSSLIVRLRLYVASTPRGGRMIPDPRSMFPAPFPSSLRRFVASSLLFELSSALHSLFLSPPLQRADLTALAHTLKVQDMSFWNRVASYPRILKDLQFAAWGRPWLRPVARLLGFIRQILVQRAMGTAAIIAMSSAPGLAQNCPDPPCFQGLGDLPGGAILSDTSGIPNPLSADGSTVVGDSSSAGGPEAFRWRAATGMIGLGDGPGASYFSTPRGCSSDGSVVAGATSSGNVSCDFGREGFRWSESSGLVLLGDAPGGCFGSIAINISSDGSVICGVANDDAGYRASYWTAGTGWVVVGPNPSSFSGINMDGTVMAGQVGAQVMRWTASAGIVYLGDLPGGADDSYVYAVSADGGVIVGRASSAAGQQGFRWTESSGMVGLDDLSGGAVNGFALGISPDGSLIVGYGTSEQGQEAVMWDSTLAVSRIVDVLVTHGVSIPAGWTLTAAAGVTINGNVVTLCGIGTNPSGNTEAWIARYALPAACDPCDTNCDGSINLFDIENFVAAITDNLPSPCSPCLGDANTDGSVNLFDIDPFVQCLTG